tara:strand:- start:1707 stop:1991 length:285 start_codon:yes stop_codon:yes gene_type:complete
MMNKIYVGYVVVNHTDEEGPKGFPIAFGDRRASVYMKTLNKVIGAKGFDFIEHSDAEIDVQEKSLSDEDVGWFEDNIESFYKAAMADITLEEAY